MSTVMNDRDVLLQATNPRYNISPDNPPAVVVTATAMVFKLVSGATSPTSTTLSAKLFNMQGTVTWSASGATIIPSGNTAQVSGSSITGSSATVTATITYLGVMYSGSVTLTKVSDGTNGTNGANGSPGGNGIRGTVNIQQGGYFGWDSAAASALVFNITGTSPLDRDMVTLHGGSFSQTRFYQSGTWYVADAYINGNMIVSGTFSANQIYGGVLDGVMILAGSGYLDNGRAFRVSSSGGVDADYMTAGSFRAQTVGLPGNPSAINATSDRASPAIAALVPFYNTSSSAHALRGSNGTGAANSSGLVGAANGYAFYDEGGGYGPFTGAHDVLLLKAATTEIGDILVDVRCVARAGLSNTIFEVITSSEERQRTAIGVLIRKNGSLANNTPAVFIERAYQGVDPAGALMYNQDRTPEYEENKDLYDLGVVNALGEGQINVCGAGGNIQAGDYIVTSSIPGKGMRQADDILRNYTVAKAREDVVFSSPSEIKLVACIYLCG